MTRYDELIKQEKENTEIRDSLKEDKERWEAARKRSYIQAFRNALPEFYQALLKNNKWTEFKYYHKILFFGVTDKIEGVRLISADGDGYTRLNCWIGKDGKYYKSASQNGNANSIISDEELAEILYDRVVRDIRYFPDKEIRDAVRENNFDEVAFQYFSTVIRRTNR
ncbi:MAG: hypothetical protein IIV88_04320 [Erysipelotrichaceae bacterium]|nr:hypothetical protein [Erysipelotrichaceae bacterium]